MLLRYNGLQRVKCLDFEGKIFKRNPYKENERKNFGLFLHRNRPPQNSYPDISTLLPRKSTSKNASHSVRLLRIPRISSAEHLDYPLKLHVGCRNLSNFHRNIRTIDLHSWGPFEWNLVRFCSPPTFFFEFGGGSDCSDGARGVLREGFASFLLSGRMNFGRVLGGQFSKIFAITHSAFLSNPMKFFLRNPLSRHTKIFCTPSAYEIFLHTPQPMKVFCTPLSLWKFFVHPSAYEIFLRNLLSLWNFFAQPPQLPYENFLHTNNTVSRTFPEVLSPPGVFLAAIPPPGILQNGKNV